MADFRKVTPQLSVSPQLSFEDVDAAADAGFKTVICNRPDGESPGQPKAETLRARAEARGLAFHNLPFSGAPSPQIAARQAALIDASDGPVLAYCRTGTRSITAWAMGRASAEETADAIAAAAEAGYDLSGLRR